ncbi:O-antigen ligase family protein [Sutcliffiella sp. NPDC057660]|uniref:O-antigen ligase family protein n=1 Tax=Sutcliffiella sp. NPDC057660 TaxID=3346199 RepID=UPI00368916BD
MLSPQKKVINKFELIMIILIAFQPIIDLLTTFSIVVLEIDFTFGVLFRFIILVLSGIYILIKCTSHPPYRKYLYYLVALFAVVTINLVVNLNVKPNFSISEEVKFAFKAVYLFIMFIAYIFVFKSLNNASLDNQSNLIKKIVYSALIIDIVMLFSILTSTSRTSYDYTKIGFTGWFFAGNEIGAILAMSFPLVVLYGVRKTTNVKNIYFWLPAILTIFSLIMVGTKVGYGAIIITILITLTMCAWEYIKTKEKSYRLNSVVSALLLLLLIIITPLTPIFQNTYSHLDLVGYSDKENNVEQHDGKKEDTVEDEQENNGLTKEQVGSLVFSSRDQYLYQHQEFFEEAPLIQKLFGMGYAGNYKQSPKLIEMDFYDLFYSYGIIGFIVIFSILIFFVAKLFLYVIKNIKTFFTIDKILISSSLALGTGIAFTAGHVLIAPAVSIYLAAILALLLNQLNLSR